MRLGTKQSLGQVHFVPGAGVLGSFRWISINPTDPPAGYNHDLGLFGKVS